MMILLSVQQDALTTPKKWQLLSRSGLFSRLRCCVCHIHHKCAMKSPAAAQEFLKTVLQQLCHFKVDVTGDANAAAYKYHKKQKSARTCTIFQLLSCSERCSARSILDSHLKKQTSSTKNRPPLLHAVDDLDCVLCGSSPPES